jgi:hypothetical protein
MVVFSGILNASDLCQFAGFAIVVGVLARNFFCAARRLEYT